MAASLGLVSRPHNYLQEGGYYACGDDLVTVASLSLGSLRRHRGSPTAHSQERGITPSAITPSLWLARMGPLWGRSGVSVRAS